MVFFAYYSIRHNANKGGIDLCIASFRSMTQAIKAKEELEKIYVSSQVINLDPNMTKKGCAYGINFDCLNLNIVESALKKKKIRFTSVFRNDLPR